MGSRGNSPERWLAKESDRTEILSMRDEEYFLAYSEYITAHKIVSYSRDPVGFFETETEGVPNDNLVFGSACHKLLLEGIDAFTREFFVYQDKDVYSASGRFCGRKSKKWLAICDAEGFSIDHVLHSREYELLRKMHLKFTESPHSDLISGCSIEKAYRWTAEGFRWQAKMDAVDTSRDIVYDLKTTSDIYSAPASIARYGYDFQASVYAMGYEAVHHVKPRVCFIFIEKKEPFTVKPIALDDLDMMSADENLGYWCDRLMGDIKARKR